MTVLNILLSFVLQVLVIIGAIFGFGYLIALCNRRFYANFGSKYMLACYVTGFVGTPVHECAHALMCLIFGHRITEMKLFQINSADGTLGYVNHSYNPRNPYQKAGNFFIGVAPIVVISALLYLFAYLLMPTTLGDMRSVVASMSFSDGFAEFFRGVYMILFAFFSAATSWRWWVFVLVGSLFALHMTLSSADIKGALSGLTLVLVVMLMIDVVLGLVSQKALASYNDALFSVGVTLDMFLLLALIISAIACLLSYVYRFTLGRFVR